MTGSNAFGWLLEDGVKENKPSSIKVKVEDVTILQVRVNEGENKGSGVKTVLESEVKGLGE